MKRPRGYLILACTGFMLATANAMAASPSGGNEDRVPQLFSIESTPDRATLQQTGNDYIQRLLTVPSNEQITVIKLNPAVVSRETPTLAVTLPDGKAAQFNLRDFNTITAGVQGWVGYKPSTWKPTHAPSAAEIDIDPLNYLSLVREGDALVGSIIVDGQLYRIDSVGSGQYALIKIDESKLPPEAEALESEQVNAVDDTHAKTPQSSHSIIRVLFVATNQRRAASPNYKLELANALNDANQYMRNSGVEVTLELAGYYEGPYDESARYYTQKLNDLRLAQPFAGELLKRRDELGAHLVTLYSSDPAFCGMAWLNPGKAQAHSVITCPTALAHEIGHNLGANHNWQPGDPVANPPYQYGYRYMGAQDRFRTQMSYDCPGASCPRLPYFSNTWTTWQGYPLGTAANHDVARRFNEQREKFEGFYPPGGHPLS
ncbi:M12 family metallo-peptidase [Pseudomonas sp. NPDC089554]|uniref:M12 family metallo-peptidase n=1 Tax=Pseudomonas sp. NPDC089554 TaxID=3390653 RepID=UPI003D033773